jgi:two-component system CheB/CheR fusion protein
VSTNADPSFERLLEYVRANRGFDYADYKRPSLMRRFQKRMEAVRIATYDDYRSYLDQDGDEFGELFDTILINVTGFFRDRESWDLLASEVIPAILENRKAPAPIRVWSAGCASGEEAYSVAILLAEALGDDQFRERTKIYATDIDERALADARTARYTAKQLEDVPEEFRERYFQEQGGTFDFRSDVRRAVIFGRNDLLHDPPISRVDLLISRNTLMYFAADAQERVLANFAFALHRRGFLMVGKAEALQSRTQLFEPYDLKRRIFVKNAAADGEARLARIVPRPDPAAHTLAAPALAEAAFESGSQGQLVIDPDGNIAAINQSARALFRLRQQDVGRPLHELEVSYRPVELRSLIEQVETERRPVSVKDVRWVPAGGEPRTLDVQVGPLSDSSGAFTGVYVSFADVTRYQALHDELDRARRDLETAYEELQSTVEELETTNEELQSTNEELETTNEELQSTNEELETMNEELQSTNEELEAMNDELRDRTDEALQANSFLGSILWSIEQGIVVLDRQLRVSTWSHAASELWGIRGDEAQGEHFLNLDFGLPVADLRDPIRNVLAGLEQTPVRLEGHNRRGQAVVCDIVLAQLKTHLDEVEGVIMVMTVSKDGARRDASE